MKNHLYKFVLVFAMLTLIATACAPQSAQPLGNAPLPQIQPTVASNQAASTSNTSGGAPHVNVLDVTHLPLGDGKISSSPQRGYVYSCQTQFNGGGAQGKAPWINADGTTWDLTKKVYVSGSVSWQQHSFNMAVNEDLRTFTTNDLPDHTTGTFPVRPSDPVYKFDANPNSIQAQSIHFSVSAIPTMAAQPTCVGNEVGIMISGVLLFSPFDAEGRDAVAHEVQDQCSAHPQQNGVYHYHSLSNCIPDTTSGPSRLLGYALDGFGIYGPYDANGKELTDADLDECHGITSQVEWDGKEVVMYHYVATREFPYVIGCFRGTPLVRSITGPNGGQGPQGTQQGGQVQPGGQSQQGGLNGQPPLEAINACTNLSAGAACSFNAPNRQISGTCQIPPQLQQLICVPQGGAHGP